MSTTTWWYRPRIHAPVVHEPIFEDVETGGAGAARFPPAKDSPQDMEAPMARKSQPAREVDGSKGQTLISVKIRLTPETLKGMRTEALGRGGSLSTLVEEYFKEHPRKFVLHERKEVSVPKEKPALGFAGAVALSGEAV